VQAIADSGFSAYSNTASGTTNPLAPTGVRLTRGDADASIAVNWNAVAGATSYQLQRSVNGGTFGDLADASESNTFSDSGVAVYNT
jgi:hypothetical protein